MRRIVAERERLPLWGPIPLRKRLQTKWPDVAWPAASTIGAILQRAGVDSTSPRPLEIALAEFDRVVTEMEQLVDAGALSQSEASG